MNPAGISFFYGSFDKNTCISELHPSIEDVVSVGKFKINKQLLVLDLTKENPELKNMFHEYYSYEYENILNFFADFVSDITKPIRVCDSELEYIPTQVLTEFIMYNPEFPFDGIKFKSSMRNGGENIVLFRGQDISYDINDPWLEFIEARKYKISRINITSELIIE